ncbi:MBL fold metallo-hydrolase [Pseudooceanicola sp.]|uniref:MBL fold metallo-hydrolase n=1 Tax=Pseudooceanicola sp. TaxID=1914328 RepID=UPI00260A442F|nr:MBL fold metallo-hydrolase [Pseudooceanicola sp.]MDF1857273.1 MBL fold metallo-hydrolase [Pseudooceanicola sp.]
MLTRRSFLITGSAATGATLVLPYAAMAAAHASHVYEAADGAVTIHPVAHASFVMETPAGVIYVDPVGETAAYATFPAPDLILVTHHHGDHFKPDTLSALAAPATVLLVNPTVHGQLPEALNPRATAIANGESAEALGLMIEAIAAYNTTEDRLKYHPQGRDNGYVVNFDGLRVYIAGDTEDIPEMRALSGIDVAFLPMNMPYTMSEEQAAAAVAAFKPKFVYPYHYRDSDRDKFAALVAADGTGSEVKFAPWYGEAMQG